MSDQVVDQVIEKLLEDPRFFEDFSRDRESTLRPFRLSSAQFAALTAINLPALFEIAKRLGEWDMQPPKMI